VELGRMSLARHALYMRVAAKLGALKVVYTLPPYQVRMLNILASRLLTACHNLMRLPRWTLVALMIRVPLSDQ